MKTANMIGRMVAIHGEQNRRIITSSLEWLDTSEPAWGLNKRTDRREFIKGLINRRKPKREIDWNKR